LELDNAISEQEIIHAINSWPSHKFPGSDGFSGEFYQKFKELMIPDLKQVLEHVIARPETTLYPLSGSHIVLIPKKSDAITPANFRPISIIHGVQRILSKILAERLQPYMEHLIHPTQTMIFKTSKYHWGILLCARNNPSNKKSNQNKLPYLKMIFSRHLTRWIGNFC
jgi:hypothetical protein